MHWPGLWFGTAVCCRAIRRGITTRVIWPAVCWQILQNLRKQIHSTLVLSIHNKFLFFWKSCWDNVWNTDDFESHVLGMQSFERVKGLCRLKSVENSLRTVHYVRQAHSLCQRLCDTLSLAEGTMSLQEVTLKISHGSCLWGVAFYSGICILTYNLWRWY